MICRIGEISFEGYLILSGCVEVRSSAGKVLAHADAGSIVGELSMLGLVTERTSELVAVEYVEAYCLNKQDLFKIFEEDDGKRMHELYQMTIDIVDIALSRYNLTEAQDARELLALPGQVDVREILLRGKADAMDLLAERNRAVGKLGRGVRALTPRSLGRVANLFSPRGGGQRSSTKRGSESEPSASQAPNPRKQSGFGASSSLNGRGVRNVARRLSRALSGIEVAPAPKSTYETLALAQFGSTASPSVATATASAAAGGLHSGMSTEKFVHPLPLTLTSRQHEQLKKLAPSLGLNQLRVTIPPLGDTGSMPMSTGLSDTATSLADQTTVPSTSGAASTSAHHSAHHNIFSDDHSPLASASCRYDCRVALEYAKPQERASRLRFFQGLDPSFIDAFFSFAIVRRYLAREVVFVEGDLLNSVVVVLCGALDLSLFRMTVRLVPGDSCGDYEYVSEVSRYRGTLVTCEHSELFVIDSQALAVLLERFPDEAKKLRESAEYRMGAWERASTVMAMSMNSLGKTNADFCSRNIPEEESHASALLQALDAKMEARFGRIELLQRELAGSLQQVQLRLARAYT